MRWQSVARAVVALIGIGSAAAVYVLMRPRPPIVETPKPPLVDNTVTGVSKGAKIKRVDDKGREIFSMNAGEMRAMADGRTVLKDDVRFRFIKGDVVYDVTASDAEASGKSGPTGEEPSQVVFRKKVKMVGDNGFSVEAEEATYLGDEQRVVFPGAVVFNRERLAGRGVGADLYMDRSVLWLNDQSRMTIEPEKGGVPVEISGKRVGLAQTDGYIRAEEGARLTRESQALNADNMTVHFAEGTQSVRRIELVGKSNVRGTGKGQRPEMRGDNIDLDFTAETGLLTHARMDTAAALRLHDDAGVTEVRSNAIDFNVGANGETLTRLEATGPTTVVLPRVGEAPAKTIQSNGLIAEGQDPKGLNRAVFSGGVQYRETLPAGRGQAAAVRLATSQTLDLDLDGALNQVSIARFRQNFCFVGPMASTASPADLQCTAGRKLPARGTLENTQAAAGDQGEYDAKAETLQLRTFGPTRPSPWVVNREVDLHARQIDLDIKRDGIKASGQVNFTRTPTAAKAKESQATGLFESGKPINARSNTLSYSKVTGIATYAGDVTIVQAGTGDQGVSSLQADQVIVDDQKQDIDATGRVRSTFYIEQAPDDSGKRGPTRTILNSERMTFKEATRTAVYTGAAVMETGDGPNRQTLDAAEITLVLEAQTRALKTLLATASGTGEVLAKLPEGRQSRGLRLTYDAGKEIYVITGKPAFVASRSTKGPDVCEVGTGTRVEFPRTGGVANVTNEGGAVVRLSEKSCAEVIK